MTPGHIVTQQAQTFAQFPPAPLQVLAPILGAKTNPVVAKEGEVILARALQVSHLHGIALQPLSDWSEDAHGASC
jgi:hypothetical protein